MNIEQLIAERSGIRLDVGCGGNKQGPDWVGIDARALPGVDIVHDLMHFPWPLPDECVSVAVASHLIEHLSPDAGDQRVAPLVRLLMDKGLITPDEVERYVGELDPGPRFIRFMNELWRVMKPDGKVALALPHGYSPGYLQDPTHCNPCNETTWAYFDPLDVNTGGMLYRIYRPSPWRVEYLAFDPSANIEVILVKRRMDVSYE